VLVDLFRPIDEHKIRTWRGISHDDALDCNELLTQALREPLDE
jgi:hypothetical protein